MLSINLTATRGLPAEIESPKGVVVGATPDPAGFAALLRQNQTAPASPRPGDAPKPPTATADPPRDPDTPDAGETRRDSDAATRARAPSRIKPRAADPTPTPAREVTLEPTPERAAVGKRMDEAPDTCEAAPMSAVAPDPVIDAGMTQWLAGLSPARPALDDVDPRRETAVRSDEFETPGADGRDGGAGRRSSKMAADTESKERVDLARTQRQDTPLIAASTAAFSGPLAELRRAETSASQPAPSDRVREAASVQASNLVPPPAGDTSVIAPTAVPIASPVQTPGFAQELGLRLSVLAQDGIESAELHLNPAEMGPVSVQIVMDGTQARIDFGADVAGTRAAIEAGLPELASALAEAGFTLAGGGVSQHAGGRRREGDGSPSNPRQTGRMASVDELSAVTGAARQVASRGGVDVFV